MRKTIILISLIVAGFMGTTLAQGNFVISGTVTGATTGQSIPNHVVNAIDSIAGTMLTTTTDANGMYSFTTTVQPGTQTMIIVTTMGFCGPNDFYAQVVIPPFMGGGATADFVICETSTNNNCQADFTYTNNIISGGINTTVDFYDTSSAGTGTITSWTWDFGDGNTSTLQDPTHVYASAGFYQVCLDIFTSDSCSSFFCDYILVGDSFPTNNCQADFFYTNFQTPTGNNNTVEFIDYSFSSAGTIVSWAWDFGDGNSSTLQDPTHVYASAGLYQVCLEIFTSDSCSSTYCENIVVNVFNPSNCQAMFYYGMSSVSPDAFTDASWATGNILTWTWDFGDGSTSTDQNPIHQFASSGYYNVCLDITTDSGCTSSYCEYILYYNSAGCSADFYSYSNNPGGYGLDYTFQDMSYGNVIEWTWDFGDGTTSTLQNPTHTYSAYGVYNVCLSIFTSDSCTSTACYDVYAIDSTSTGCNAYFAYGGTGGIMLPGVFVDGSTSTGNILAWFWSFGDGAYSTDQNPTHYYASSGYYNVCLDIVTDNGCADTYCDTIYYDSTGVSWCNANFDYVFNPSINCVYGYDFTDFSTASGNILSWTWDFDDGTTSTDQNPVHCFSATGVYHVCLEIMTDDSCTSSYCNYIHVTNNPNLFNVGGTVYAGGSSVTSGMVLIMGVTGSIYASDINPSGTYLVTDVPEDTYIAYAIPAFSNYPNYVPTYHDSTLFWGDAIEVLVQSDTSTIDIYLQEYSQTTTGPGTIGGNIIWLGGGTKSSNTYKDRMNPSIEDISVLLFDMGDNLLNFDLTDVDGNFQFNNLQYGTYKLIVELTGHTTYPAIITIDSNNPTVDDIIIDIDNGTVYYDVEEISAIGDGAKLYPNPAHNDLNIEFMLNKLSDVKISVLNALGQEIISVNQELSSGQQKINLDVSKLESGIYFINIEANGLDKKVLKFVK